MAEQYLLSAPEILSKMDDVFRITVAQAVRYHEHNPEEQHRKGWHRVGIDILPILRPFAPLYLPSAWVLAVYSFPKMSLSLVQVWALPKDAHIPEVEEFHASPDEGFPKPHPPLARPPISLIQGDDSPQSYLLALLLSAFFRGFMLAEATWELMRLVIDYHALDASDERDRRIKQSIDGMVRWYATPTQWQPTVVFEGEAVYVSFYSRAAVIEYSIYHFEGEFQRGRYEPVRTKRTLIAH